MQNAGIRLRNNGLDEGGKNRLGLSGYGILKQQSCSE